MLKLARKRGLWFARGAGHSGGCRVAGACSRRNASRAGCGFSPAGEVAATVDTSQSTLIQKTTHQLGKY